MKLSVIIVNYNVKYFIEQCLHSVFKSLKAIDSEVFVVDNNSVDGSCALIKEKFPQVKLIENKQNVGFSKANNQAIRISQGKFVLLLNPDTVVEENTFEKVLQFMDEHIDAGGLGVKMIDGKGKFLPESKRALPTPEVSFYKIFGLSSLFPKSKRFSKYHLGYLDKNQIHEVEILSGAFMLLRKKTLDEIGLLDENFFMYGEDVDLSYRIIKGGYKNYYFPETTIIHYKGESTKKGSINYVFIFYNAMIIFAKKHFSEKNAKIYSFLINFAIYFRAFLSIIKRFIQSFSLPIIDFAGIFAGFFIMLPIYQNLRFNSIVYPDYYTFIIVPIYILIWIISLYFSGGYEKTIKFLNIIKGIGIGTIIILIIYSLLNENYRFSRALILFGSFWTLLVLFFSRYFLHFFKISDYKLESKKKKRILIVGDISEKQRVEEILRYIKINFEIIGLVSFEKTNDYNYIGDIDELDEIVKINKIDEIIFCSKDTNSSKIINKMLQLSDLKVDYKIAPPESFSIIGSNSIDTAGELYSVEFNSITKEKNIRLKKLFDFSVSCFLLMFFPFFVWFVDNKKGFLKNIFYVIIGRKTWIGYSDYELINKYNLPKIKKGILNPTDIYGEKTINEKILIRSNINYAKDYHVFNDFKIFFNGFSKLGKYQK